jgi:hypothetical protein
MWNVGIIPHNNPVEERMASSAMLHSVALPLQSIVFRRNVRRLLVRANAVPSSPHLVTLITESLNSTVISLLIRSTRHNIPEDGILHSHRRENLKSYIALTGWTL